MTDLEFMCCFCNQPIDNITKKFDILGESGIGNALVEYISLHKEVLSLAILTFKFYFARAIAIFTNYLFF